MNRLPKIKKRQNKVENKLQRTLRLYTCETTISYKVSPEKQTPKRIEPYPNQNQHEDREGDKLLIAINGLEDLLPSQLISKYIAEGKDPRKLLPLKVERRTHYNQNGNCLPSKYRKAEILTCSTYSRAPFTLNQLQSTSVVEFGLNHEADHAAVVIQSVWRMHNTYWITWGTNGAWEHNRATVIEKLCRGYLSRKSYRLSKLKMSLRARQLQKYWRARYAMKVKACLKIQVLWRGILGRRCAQEVREFYNDAAIKIQRSFMSKYNAERKWMLCQFVRNMTSVQCQRIVRGHQGRQEVRRRRYAQAAQQQYSKDQYCLYALCSFALSVSKASHCWLRATHLDAQIDQKTKKAFLYSHTLFKLQNDPYSASLLPKTDHVTFVKRCIPEGIIVDHQNFLSPSYLIVTVIEREKLGFCKQNVFCPCVDCGYRYLGISSKRLNNSRKKTTGTPMLTIEAFEPSTETIFPLIEITNGELEEVFQDNLPLLDYSNSYELYRMLIINMLQLEVVAFEDKDIDFPELDSARTYSSINTQQCIQTRQQTSETYIAKSRLKLSALVNARHNLLCRRASIIIQKIVRGLLARQHVYFTLKRARDMNRQHQRNVELIAQYRRTRNETRSWRNRQVTIIQTYVRGWQERARLATWRQNVLKEFITDDTEASLPGVNIDELKMVVVESEKRWKETKMRILAWQSHCDFNVIAFDRTTGMIYEALLDGTEILYLLLFPRVHQLSKHILCKEDLCKRLLSHCYCTLKQESTIPHDVSESMVPKFLQAEIKQRGSICWNNHMKSVLQTANNDIQNLLPRQGLLSWKLPKVYQTVLDIEAEQLKRIKFDKDWSKRLCSKYKAAAFESSHQASNETVRIKKLQVLLGNMSYVLDVDKLEERRAVSDQPDSDMLVLQLDLQKSKALRQEYQCLEATERLLLTSAQQAVINATKYKRTLETVILNNTKERETLINKIVQIWNGLESIQKKRRSIEPLRLATTAARLQKERVRVFERYAEAVKQEKDLEATFINTIFVLEDLASTQLKNMKESESLCKPRLRIEKDLNKLQELQLDLARKLVKVKQEQGNSIVKGNVDLAATLRKEENWLRKELDTVTMKREECFRNYLEAGKVEETRRLSLHNMALNKEDI